MAQVILFEHSNFHGNHKHLFNTEANLNAQDDNWFNDKVSSFVILEGNWPFFKLGCSKLIPVVTKCRIGF